MQRTARHNAPMTAHPTPASAWAELVAGNERFAAGAVEHPHSDPTRRSELTGAQHPFATVFGCSDSRAPVERVFDRGLGDIFTVRTAGHIVDTAVLSSIEFSVAALRVPLLVILGHESCGAVMATIASHRDGQVPGGWIRDVVERVTPSLLTLPPVDGPDEVRLAALVAHHARATADLLVERSSVVREAVAAGELAVVPAQYRLSDGRIEAVGPTP